MENGVRPRGTTEFQIRSCTIRSMTLFVLIGALVGLFIGGLAGLVFGGLLGYGLGLFMLNHLLPRGLGAIREQFFDSTFAVMGAVCKADGVVSRDEIRVAEQFFDILGLSAQQRTEAQASFNRGKCEGFDLYGEVVKLRGMVGNNRALLQLFLHVQLSAMAADGVVHDKEFRIFQRIAHALGLSDGDVKRLLAGLRGSSGTSQSSDGGLGDDYAVLGVTPSASDAEIKKAYRRLMSQHHPDKLAARGMPENMRPVAEERVREVRRAYDRISERRERKPAA